MGLGFYESNSFFLLSMHCLIPSNSCRSMQICIMEQVHCCSVSVWFKSVKERGACIEEDMVYFSYSPVSW